MKYSFSRYLLDEGKISGKEFLEAFNYQHKKSPSLAVLMKGAKVLSDDEIATFFVDSSESGESIFKLIESKNVLDSEKLSEIRDLLKEKRYPFTKALLDLQLIQMDDLKEAYDTYQKIEKPDHCIDYLKLVSSEKNIELSESGSFDESTVENNQEQSINILNEGHIREFKFFFESALKFSFDDFADVNIDSEDYKSKIDTLGSCLTYFGDVIGIIPIEKVRNINAQMNSLISSYLEGKNEGCESNLKELICSYFEVILFFYENMKDGDTEQSLLDNDNIKNVFQNIEKSIKNENGENE